MSNLQSADQSVRSRFGSTRGEIHELGVSSGSEQRRRRSVVEQRDVLSLVIFKAARAQFWQFVSVTSRLQLREEKVFLRCEETRHHPVRHSLRLLRQRFGEK